MSITAVRRALAAAAIGAMVAGPAAAHDFWVHAGHYVDPDSGQTVALVNVGWGHSLLPISEFLAGDRLGAYRVIDPAGRALDLPFDRGANKSLAVDGAALPGLARLQAGDPFVRRLVFGADAAKGTYRVIGAMALSPRTEWLDAKGDKRDGSVFPDQVKDALRIVASFVTVRSSAAYWPLGNWTAPQAAGLAIELVPTGDVSKSKTGQPVSFRVFRDGKPLATRATVAAELLGAGGRAQGKVDGATVTATPPGPGPWLLRVAFAEPLPDTGPLAAFRGRVEQARYVATATFEVKP